ncbi:MAG: hypothetical protein AMK73_05660 [Planctomycetes bacterium SM23_32]|nr:MAG: hypothetical protein AMK73_05660 [Planctomycetes bacterium SM23_32]
MKKLFVIVLLIVVAFILYNIFVSGVMQQQVHVDAEGVIKGVVRSGHRVGEGAGKAFDSVDFGGRR